MSEYNLDFTYAYGKPSVTADFRSETDDFIVYENLGFELSGEGEHLFVQICKRGENTGWVAEKLAQFFNLKTVDVGFAGMKDRHAKTTQWFSLYLPKYTGEPDWAEFIASSQADVNVIESGWHKQKLRRGMHASNRFEIRLRNLSSSENIPERIQKIIENGVPNYFGEQRFGREGGNLILARRWMEDGEQIRKKKLRGMVMSAARSYLFNLVLEARIQKANWNTCLEGDTGDNPTGPLWGRGRPLVDKQAAAFEDETLNAFSKWCEQLEHCGLSQERRPLVLNPADFSWEQIDKDLILSFSLSPGLYATSVLREIAQLNNISQANFPSETD